MEKIESCLTVVNPLLYFYLYPVTKYWLLWIEFEFMAIPCWWCRFGLLRLILTFWLFTFTFIFLLPRFPFVFTFTWFLVLLLKMNPLPWRSANCWLWPKPKKDSNGTDSGVLLWLWWLWWLPCCDKFIEFWSVGPGGGEAWKVKGNGKGWKKFYSWFGLWGAYSRGADSGGAS